MPTKFRDLEKMLRTAGFTFDHAVGSHYTYEHPTKGKITVPFHGSNMEIAPGTLKDILKKAGLK
jgi:predicted RNA binding protein YcfA (HicA-like mRNA interferase family)